MQRYPLLLLRILPSTKHPARSRIDLTVRLSISTVLLLDLLRTANPDTHTPTYFQVSPRLCTPETVPRDEDKFDLLWALEARCGIKTTKQKDFPDVGFRFTATWLHAGPCGTRDRWD